MSLPGFGSSLAVLVVCSSSLTAQDNQSAPRYGPEQLHCSRFREIAYSRIQTQSGRQDRAQRSGRTGVWQFRAKGETGGVALEGWLDSLVLWRRSAETTIQPDTDGLIGGRYQGSLSPGGTYTGRVQPFIPDEVAEVAGMATALDDFFPPVPSRPLHPGETWRGSPGVTVERLPDSALSGVPLYRYRLEISRKSQGADPVQDSVALELSQVSRETGTYVWHPLIGLLARDRTIVVETTVPASGDVRQAIRSRIQQRIRVTRDPDFPGDRSDGCGNTAPS